MSPGVPLLAALIVALCGVSYATDSGPGSAVYASNGVVVVEGLASSPQSRSLLDTHSLRCSLALLHTIKGAKEVVLSNAATG